MSRYIPPEEMSEAQIREQLDAEYQWLETATDILCAAFWAIVGAMAVVWLARFFLGRH